MFFADEEKLEL